MPTTEEFDGYCIEPKNFAEVLMGGQLGLLDDSSLEKGEPNMLRGVCVFALKVNPPPPLAVGQMAGSYLQVNWQVLPLHQSVL